MTDDKNITPNPQVIGGSMTQLKQRLRIGDNSKTKQKQNDIKDRGDELHPRFNAFLDRFCEHYDAKLAAIQTGYSDSVARDAARAILRRPDVWREFTRRERANMLTAGVTPSRLMRIVAGVALTSPEDLMSWDNNELRLKSSDNLSEEQLAAVKSIEFTETYTRTGEPIKRVKVQMYDRLKAVDLLHRLMALHKTDYDPESDKKQVFKIGDNEIAF